MNADNLLKISGLVSESETPSSIMLFRLEDSWFCLPTMILSEVVESMTIHRVPHRSGKILLGLVNVHGQIRICASLHLLLGLEKVPSHSLPMQTFKEALVINYEEEVWVLPVDGIQGIHPIRIENILLNRGEGAKFDTTFIKAMIHLENKQVTLINEKELFAALRRSLL